MPIADPIVRKDRVNRYDARRYAEFRAKIDAIKLASGCVDCPPGTVWHPAALDFDHLDPSEKSFKIASASGRAWDEVLKEIAKCVVRCKNHHAAKTALLKETSKRKGYRSFANVELSEEGKTLLVTVIQQQAIMLAKRTHGEIPAGEVIYRDGGLG